MEPTAAPRLRRPRRARPPRLAALCALTALQLLPAQAFAARAQAATAGSPPATSNSARTAGAPGALAADGNLPPNVNNDEPPATAYDRLGEQGGLALAPESLGLLSQLGRTLLALAATLALIYLFFKLLWPRLVAKVVPRSRAELQVTERLVLDGNNALVTVEHKDGRRYLLACGAQGVVVVDREAAPAGGPLASASSRPRLESFADALAAKSAPPHDAVP